MPSVAGSAWWLFCGCEGETCDIEGYTVTNNIMLKSVGPKNFLLFIRDFRRNKQILLFKRKTKLSGLYITGENHEQLNYVVT